MGVGFNLNHVAALARTGSVTPIGTTLYIYLSLYNIYIYIYIHTHPDLTTYTGTEVQDHESPYLFIACFVIRYHEAHHTRKYG